MNKKMIALALAAAFAAPAAFADTGTVKVTGYINLSLDRLDTDTPPAAGTEDSSWYVSSNASNIVFSGDEPLGNGLKAIWQMQTFVNFGGTATKGAEQPGLITGGNSFAGLQGGWGTVLLGKNDTPFKVLGRKVDLFGNQIGESRSIISASPSIRGVTYTPQVGGWDQRPHSIVQYNSPAWSGFQASIQYGPEEGTTDGDRWSASIGYESGPLLVGLAYERHNAGTTQGVTVGAPFTPSVTTATNTGDENALRFAAGYSFGNTRLVGLYQQINDANGVSDADVKMWGLGAAHKFGAHTVKAQYYKADDIDGLADTGANMWAVGWDYAFSKRTTAYVAYARTKNDANVGYSPFGGGYGQDPYAAAGTDRFGRDPSGFSLGLVHKF